LIGGKKKHGKKSKVKTLSNFGNVGGDLPETGCGGTGRETSLDTEILGKGKEKVATGDIAPSEVWGVI